MKAKSKTVLLATIALLDCTLGGLLISSSIGETNYEKVADVKASANYVDKTVSNVENDILITLEAEKISVELENASKDVTEKLNEQSKQDSQNITKNENVAQVVTENKQSSDTETTEIETSEKIVYGDMTLSQLSAKLNRSLKSDLSGKGNLIASYSLSKGVDPYVATAIMLVETGCNSGTCSSLVKSCNNVGGMIGSGCNGYMAFSDLDTGIKKFIDNLAKNYYSQGLNTPEKMNSKYAASTTWSSQVNSYIAQIKKN